MAETDSRLSSRLRESHSPLSSRSGDPELCIRCGQCKTQCPTHIQFGTEGMSGRGRMELAARFLADEIDSSDFLAELLNTCLLCGYCDSGCPRGLSVTGAVYDARTKLVLNLKKEWFCRELIKYASSYPGLACGLLRFLQQSGLLPVLKRIKPFSTIRALGLRVPEESLTKEISVFRVANPRGRVAIFAGCAVNFLDPSLGVSCVQALNAMDFEVIMPKGEACCGAPLLSMGLRNEVERVAAKNLSAFRKLNVDAVISPCPTCTHFIKDIYLRLFGDGVVNATDISSFICDSSLLSTLQPVYRNTGNIVYHDPCHSVNYLRAVEQPRVIMRSLGLTIKEPEEKGCCGLNGAVRLLHGNVSETIGQKRAAALEVADTIVTSCPHCIIQLGSMIKDRPIKHIIELIAAGVRKK
jgi:glycolate oxidase iron-sulfur subunit